MTKRPLQLTANEALKDVKALPVEIRNLREECESLRHKLSKQQADTEWWRKESKRHQAVGEGPRAPGRHPLGELVANARRLQEECWRMDAALRSRQWDVVWRQGGRPYRAGR